MNNKYTVSIGIRKFESADFDLGFAVGVNIVPPAPTNTVRDIARMIGLVKHPVLAPISTDKHSDFIPIVGVSIPNVGYVNSNRDSRTPGALNALLTDVSEIMTREPGAEVDIIFVESSEYSN